MESRVFRPPADVYSFAIVCWEIFCDAALPFGQATHAEIRDNVKHDTYRPMLPPHCPPKVSKGTHTHLQIQQLIKSCWSSAPSERPSMDEVVEELVKFR